MNKSGILLALAVSMLSSTALANHKPGHTQNNQNAPGQDRVCLVTMSGDDVVGREWLPRKAAEAQADGETTFIRMVSQDECEALIGGENDDDDDDDDDEDTDESDDDEDVPDGNDVPDDDGDIPDDDGDVPDEDGDLPDGDGHDDSTGGVDAPPPSSN